MRFDVSTVSPAADTVPLLLTRLVSMLDVPSDATVVARCCEATSEQQSVGGEKAETLIYT
jgi:hypothetical protein